MCGDGDCTGLCGCICGAWPSGADDDMLKDLHAGIVRAANMFWVCVDWRGYYGVEEKSVQSKDGGKLYGDKPSLAGLSLVRRNGAKAGDVICVTRGTGRIDKG